uniref:Uncharacterized protein n=1 Tax=Macaca fascicularis TaxID=9541 RepID=A0A7N9CE14_MACFA
MLLIKTYLRLGRKRSLIGLTVPHGWGGLRIMAGGKRHILHGNGQRNMRKMQKQKPLIEPSDLVRLIHYHKNSMGETAPVTPIISHQIPPTTHGNYGSIIGDEIWVGTQSQTMSLPDMVTRQNANSNYIWEVKNRNNFYFL